MKMLLEHMVYFRCEVVDKPCEFEPQKPTTNSNLFEVGNSLVVYVNVESADQENGSHIRAASIISNIASELGVMDIVIYPFAHLEHARVDAEVALLTLTGLREQLSFKDPDRRVLSIPFGTIKTREGKTHAHRRAVLLRTVR